MTQLFYGNFDFEHALSGRRGAAAAGVLARTNAELAAAWVAVAEAGDLIWTPVPIESEFPARLAAHGFPEVRMVGDWRDVPPGVPLRPWGWTDSVRRLARERGGPFDAPPQAAVRAANSRRFSSALEREWNIALPGAAEAHSVEELAHRLRQLPAGCERWVIKAEFGMSARERILGTGREPSSQVVHWVRRRVADGGVVFLEPWVERIEEVGLQFTVLPTGAPAFEGLTPLLSGPGGEYRGSRFDTDAGREQTWATAIACGHRAAGRAAELGYFGPLGIDALRYRDVDGEIRVRPLQDINARHTMGRLSLGLRRVLAPGQAGVWLHVRWPTGDANAPLRWMKDFQKRLPEGTRAMPTAPFVVGDRPTSHGAVVVLAASAADLAAAIQAVTPH